MMHEFLSFFVDIFSQKLVILFDVFAFCGRFLSWIYFYIAAFGLIKWSLNLDLF